ncbi:DMT family transporter [Sedimenticola sp.]|uniref:DMT family transporter n=1 Tax=Sedimenticola sp. TaxID=1940285 RepID=UPI003D100925
MLLIALSIVAGVAIVLQATLNAHLGELLASSLLATVIAFISGAFYLGVAAVVLLREPPTVETVYAVPGYLWFTGGLFSALAVALFYYLIPKMGVASMLSYSLSGQLLFGLVASHFGWFQLPVSTLSSVKILGAVLMIAAIFMINRG